jgi:hypothetical protein
MQHLYDLKSKFNNLTITTTSAPSSASDTSMQNTRNSGQNGPRPKYPIRKPTMRLFPETQNIKPLPTVRIVTKHSHGFNSERATGLDKLQQLQFVEQLKGMIVGELFHFSSPESGKVDRRYAGRRSTFTPRTLFKVYNIPSHHYTQKRQLTRKSGYFCQ